MYVPERKFLEIPKYFCSYKQGSLHLDSWQKKLSTSFDSQTAYGLHIDRADWSLPRNVKIQCVKEQEKVNVTLRNMTYFMFKKTKIW
jgi:hypothetical protein